MGRGRPGELCALGIARQCPGSAGSKETGDRKRMRHCTHDDDAARRGFRHTDVALIPTTGLVTGMESVFTPSHP
jgi:hypothetical protein